MSDLLAPALLGLAVGGLVVFSQRALPKVLGQGILLDRIQQPVDPNFQTSYERAMGERQAQPNMNGGYGLDTRYVYARHIHNEGAEAKHYEPDRWDPRPLLPDTSSYMVEPWNIQI